MINSLSNATYLNHLNQHELMTAKAELELVVFYRRVFTKLARNSFRKT